MIEVRRFRPDEWEVFKTVRLKALQQDPGVFTSTYQRESPYPDDLWKSRLEDPQNGVFGVFDGEKPIGLTGIFIHSDDSTGKRGGLVSSWLEPDYRGKGISRLMYEARIGWAKEHPTCEILEVGIRESNQASKRACERFGFELVETELQKIWPDGAVESLQTYQLRVK